MAEAKVTTDHEKIRKWVEARGGRPARVKGTGRGDDPGILRIDYPGFSGEDTLEPISWSKWLKAFDEDKLALLYEERPNSRFSKLVARARAATPIRAGAAKRTMAKRTTKASSAKKTSTTRKTPRPLAARIGKAPTPPAAKKRGAAKKPSSAKKRTSAKKR